VEQAEFAPGTVIVMLKPDASNEEFKRYLGGDGLSIINYLSTLGTYLIRVPDGEEIRWVKIFGSRPNVRAASVTHRIGIV